MEIQVPRVGWGRVGSYRRGLLGELPIKPVCEALEQSVPASDDDTAVETLGAERRVSLRIASFPFLRSALVPSPSLRSWSHRANVNVTHADAGGDHVTHS